MRIKLRKLSNTRRKACQHPTMLTRPLHWFDLGDKDSETSAESMPPLREASRSNSDLELRAERSTDDSGKKASADEPSSPSGLFVGDPYDAPQLIVGASPDASPHAPRNYELVKFTREEILKWLQKTADGTAAFRVEEGSSQNGSIKGSDDDDDSSADFVQGVDVTEDPDGASMFYNPRDVQPLYFADLFEKTVVFGQTSEVSAEQLVGQRLAYFVRDLCGALRISERDAYANARSRGASLEDYERHLDRPRAKEYGFCVGIRHEQCAGVAGRSGQSRKNLKGELKELVNAMCDLSELNEHKNLKFARVNFWGKETSFKALKSARPTNFSKQLHPLFADYLFEHYAAGELASLVVQAQDEIRNSTEDHAEVTREFIMNSTGRADDVASDAEIFRSLLLEHGKILDKYKAELMTTLVQLNYIQKGTTWYGLLFTLLVKGEYTPPDNIGARKYLIVSWEHETISPQDAVRRWESIGSAIEHFRKKVYSFEPRRPSKFIVDPQWKLNFLRLVQGTHEERLVNSDSRVDSRAYRGKQARDRKLEALYFFQMMTRKRPPVRREFVSRAGWTL